jgi:hypothetical protein
MANGSHTHMKLLINRNNPDDVTAEMVTLDANRNETAKVDLATSQITIEALFNKGPIQLGVIYYTHMSPGCVYYIGNKKYEFC